MNLVGKVKIVHLSQRIIQENSSRLRSSFSWSTYFGVSTSAVKVNSAWLKPKNSLVSKMNRELNDFNVLGMFASKKKKRTGNVLYYTLGQEWEDKSESAT